MQEDEMPLSTFRLLILKTEAYAATGNRPAPESRWTCCRVSSSCRVSLLIPAGLALLSLVVFALPASGAQEQAPKGHFAPSQQASPEALAQRQIREALYGHGTILNLPLNVQTEVRQAEGQDEDIAIQAQLDVSSLAFQKQGDRNVDSVVFAVALFDPDGKYVTGSQQRCNLSLADDARTEMEKRGFSLKTHVSAKAGRYTVRVVVRDSEGAKIAALSKAVEVPSQISPPAAQQITTPEPGGVVSGGQGGKAATGGRATTAPSPVAAPTEQLIAPLGQGARDSQIRQLPTLNQATDMTSLILPPLPSKLTAGSDEASFEAYRIAEPITEWPLEKVRHRIPELKGLKPATATDQSQLAEILRGVSANIQKFVVDFTDTTALETIEEARQAPGEYVPLLGRSPVAKTITQKFRYLMLAQREGGGFSLVEYRTDPGTGKKSPGTDWLPQDDRLCRAAPFLRADATTLVRLSLSGPANCRRRQHRGGSLRRAP